MLEKERIKITMARNGREGLEAFFTYFDLFNLIITDLRMPHMR